jgi:hypothetical protein
VKLHLAALQHVQKGQCNLMHHVLDFHTPTTLLHVATCPRNPAPMLTQHHRCQPWVVIGRFWLLLLLLDCTTIFLCGFHTV